MTCPSGFTSDSRAIINAAKAIASNSLPFHALDKPCVSSSWLSQIPSFRQETCQAYYRNNPVKYDLNHNVLHKKYVKLSFLSYYAHINFFLICNQNNTTSSQFLKSKNIKLTSLML